MEPCSADFYREERELAGSYPASQELRSPSVRYRVAKIYSALEVCEC